MISKSLKNYAKDFFFYVFYLHKYLAFYLYVFDEINLRTIIRVNLRTIRICSDLFYLKFDCNFQNIIKVM